MQQFGLNAQSDLGADVLLEIAYVGTRGTSLLRTRTLNQALDASPGHPIRGVVQNTLANVQQRVPVPGVIADNLKMTESEGNSWYNGLEASLTKRLHHGLSFLPPTHFPRRWTPMDPT